MLKFSGYSYLIRGQPLRLWRGFTAGARRHAQSERYATALGVDSEPATAFRSLRAAAGPQRKPGGLDG